MPSRQRMKVLGITGGVGAGKSTVLEYLEERYSARVIQCDEAAKQLQEPGGLCYEPMVRLFGPQVLLADGSFDRKKIADLVFSDRELREKLNGIVHPGVKRYVTKEMEKARSSGQVSLLVIEAALLLEERYDLLCDEIWYIHTREEARRRRLKASRGYSDEKINRIMAAQKPDEYFREHCQFVVDNSSDNVENTYEQIDKGLREHGIL